MFSISLFTMLKQRASADIAALKADVRSVETRIEAAFHLGIVAQTLQAIESSPLSLADKLREAFSLGKSHAQLAVIPTVSDTTAAPADTVAPTTQVPEVVLSPSVNGAAPAAATS